MALGVTPAQFDRVEFWRISREPFKLKPIRVCPCIPSSRCAMRVQVIPDYYDFMRRSAVQLVVQLPQKVNHFFSHVAVEGQLKIERRMFLRRRQRQCANCRNATIVPSRDQLHRRLSTGCPSTMAVRLQQKACFIDKNNASFVAQPPFLSAATRVFSTARRTQSPVPSRDAEAFDTTSPTCVTIAKRSYFRMLFRNTVRSPRRHVGKSKVHSETHTLRRHFQGCAQCAASEPRTISTVDPDEPWTPMPRPHRPQRPAAIVRHYSMRHQQAVRRLHVNGRPTTSYLQSVASFRVPLQYLWFSCRNHTCETTNRH